jgi:peptide/nickel transport system substrate-binding protein/oligopeptide transport system substrate-binding protein
VRSAFAKALDRESIVNNVINADLTSRFRVFVSDARLPASTAVTSPIQAYDREAQALLAKRLSQRRRLPALELKLRGEGESVAQRFIASAASISDCLNVEITVNNIEYKTYMDALLARPTQLQFGAVSYGMDYLDPSNMLGVWHSRGRHSWRNEDFDKLIDDAAVFVGDPEERFQMYRDAERILVEDVGGIFLDHRIQGNLFQPYVAGDCFRPNAQGVSAWQWGNDWCWGRSRHQRRGELRNLSHQQAPDGALRRARHARSTGSTGVRKSLRLRSSIILILALSMHGEGELLTARSLLP